MESRASLIKKAKKRGVKGPFNKKGLTNEILEKFAYGPLYFKKDNYFVVKFPDLSDYIYDKLVETLPDGKYIVSNLDNEFKKRFIGVSYKLVNYMFTIAELTGKQNNEYSIKFTKSIAKKINDRTLIVKLKKRSDINLIPHLPKIYKLELFATHDDTIFDTGVYAIRPKKEEFTELLDIADKMSYTDYPRYFRIVLTEPIPVKDNLLFTGEMNCFMEQCILRSNLSEDVVKRRIYKKHPEFEHSNPGVSREIAESMVRSAQLCSSVYTELGIKLKQPWYELGDKSRAKIDIVVKSDSIGNNHATLLRKKYKCESYVIIKEEKVSLTVDEEGSITCWEHSDNLPYFKDECCRGTDWVISYNKGKSVMHKKFQPSKYFKVFDADYINETTPHSLLFKLLKETYPLEPTTFEKEITKNEERFVGRGILGYTDEPLAVIDRNKSFIAYKSNPYYFGFNTDKGIRIKCSYIIDDPVYKPKSVNYSYFRFRDDLDSQFAMEANNMLPPLRGTMLYSEYLFYQNYADIVIESVSYSPIFDMDLIGFTDLVIRHNMSEKMLKEIRNSAVGMLISGGMEEKMSHEFYGNEELLDQMEYECDKNNLRYIREYDHIRVWTDRYSILGVFHIHSQILAYSNISLMMKYIDLRKKGILVYAYTVDSFTVKVSDLYKVELGNEIGEWKREIDKKDPTKYRFPTLDSSDLTTSLDYHPFMHYTSVPALDLPELLNNDVVIIDGAPGIGKTHRFMNTKLPGAILLEPTRELRNAKINDNIDVKTYQWYYLLYQKNKDRRRERIKPIVILDEYYCIPVQDLYEIIKITKQDGSKLVLLGDSAQLRNDFNALHETHDTITRDFLRINMTRTDKSRHSMVDGQYLDQFRYKPYTDILHSNFTKISQKYLLTKNPNTYKIVSGNHKRISQLNKLIRDELIKKKVKKIQVRRISDKSIVTKSISNQYIWWDKEAYDADGEGYEFLPIFAETIDCIQGQTIINKKIVVDINHLQRKGAAYTAITRTNNLGNTILLVDSIQRKETKYNEYESPLIQQESFFKGGSDFVNEFMNGLEF